MRSRATRNDALQPAWTGMYPNRYAPANCFPRSKVYWQTSAQPRPASRLTIPIRLSVELNRMAKFDRPWMADTTSIRLKDEFVYFVVILDSYSRNVAGWPHRLGFE